MMASPSGGRFDFDDGGTYCGGWQDGKAHGHGVCTGPKNVGEYSGSWNFGFEMSGVYKWTNGAVYEGRWQNGKRHGVGVEYNGKWIYKGEWSQGLKGRYGVKASSNSAVKYEGTWANGLQDGYGSETYSDGGYYQGQMCRGLRHGYGVRKSAPYGDSQLNNPGKNGPLMGGAATGAQLLHANSIQSTGSAAELLAATGAGSTESGLLDHDDSPKPEDGFKPNIDRTLVSKNGFVLVAKPLDVPMATQNSMAGSPGSLSSSKHRRGSLTNRLLPGAQRIPSQPAGAAASLLRRGLRLRKQKSTSDLDAAGLKQRSATPGAFQQLAGGGDGHLGDSGDSSPMIPFTLAPEELDITDPTTVETYMGEWKHDKRNGHGVCERSDGLRYEGQWHNDMKCGYGVTTFKDGTKQEGKYKNNLLIVDSRVKRFFQLTGSNIRQRIDDSLKMAHQAQSMALKKAEIADTRAATARDKADQAMTAAIEADRDSQIAYAVARQYSDSSNLTQQQQQLAMQFGQPFGSQFMAPNLNMSSSPLQLRRISAHNQAQQQRQAAFGQTQTSLQNMLDADSQSQQQLQHQQQQQMQLEQEHQQKQGTIQDNLEPFNGRRGSFRAQQPPVGSLNSSNYTRQPSFRHHAQQQQQPQYQVVGANQRRHMPFQHHQSTDPFSDLFDHYRSSAATGGSSGYRPGGGGPRRGLFKQTSLDQAQLGSCSGAGNYARGTSVPRHLGHHGQQLLQQQRFRHSSSVDQADSEQRHDGIEHSQANQEQSLRHLVTSGEQLQQQQQQQQLADRFVSPTPSSSYILLHSSADGSANSNTFNNSPALTNLSGQAQANGADPNYQQQAPISNAQFEQQQQRPQQMYYPSQRQRDAQSLADEQLTMTNYRRRALRAEPLGRTDFENYDFAVTSAPRPAQRCRRRTASLTRAASLTPPLASSDTGTCRQNSMAALTANQFSAAAAAGKHQQTVNALPTFSLNSPESVDANSGLPLASNSSRNANNLSPMSGKDQQQQQHSGCTNSLSGSSAGGMSRKPSLQVRYDPIELGGLMSREEVAALSHAQREQKRIEAEMAEKRAKQPLLHLYMSIREFVECNRLIIAVVIINICLVRMFANLVRS